MSHFAVKPLLKVGFPSGVKRVGGRLDLDVTHNWDACQWHKINRLHLAFSVALDVTRKVPASLTVRRKVTLANPCRGFLRVTTTRPSPEHEEYLSLNRDENPLADHMPMIVRPTPNHRVENRYQLTRRDVLVGADGVTDFVLESLDALFTRLDEQLLLEFANGLSEKIEAVFEMGDARLRCR